MHAKSLAFLVLLPLSACKSSHEAGVKDDEELSAPAPAEVGEETEAGGARETTPQVLDRAGVMPCPGELGSAKGFRCLTRREALDHFDRGGKSGGKTIDVTFAIHPASKQPAKGLLINIDGGPGFAGLDSADDYSATEPKITEQFDIVWFDVRGVGRSGGMECADAANAFFTGGTRAVGAAEEADLLARARAFPEACIAEVETLTHGAIARADLPFYNTRQVVEDLDDLRAFLHFDKVKIYGLSYGTQVAQTYVQFHPDRVESFVIDGVVDLTLGHTDYMVGLNRGILKILDLSFGACAASPTCARSFPADVGGSAAAAFAKAVTLLARPVAVSKGQVFSRRDFDGTSFDSMGNAAARRDFLKALPAAARGNFSAMFALSGLADADESAPSGPHMSLASYFTITCNDYGKQNLDEYLAAGRALAKADGRLLAPFYVDLPCAFWTVTPTKPPRPSPLRAAGIPALVVGATGDAATPFAMGEKVFAALDKGHRILYSGGNHVMYGSGSCGDSLISGFFLGNETPKVTSCSDAVIAPGSFKVKRHKASLRTM